MTDCNKIQANNLACNKISLTEQWQKGELPSGWYYINSNYYENGSLMWCENGIFIACGDIVPAERITEVLEPVPSYEQWQKHRKTLLKTQEKNCDLEIINTQLKALLKEVGGITQRRSISICVKQTY